MAKIAVKLVQAEYGFVASDESGKSIQMDNSEESGGKGFGVRPMQNLLMALGGCSGIDIVSILKKQRQGMEGLEIHIEGEREKDKTPALWKTVHMKFLITGSVSQDKAEMAARLSVDKYCSVAETLRRAGCDITWELSLIPAEEKA